MIDIFDTRKIDDIPKKIQNQLNTGKSKQLTYHDKLKKLLRMSTSELSLDQIFVGYYRTYLINNKNTYIPPSLKNMIYARLKIMVTSGEVIKNNNMYRLKEK